MREGGGGVAGRETTVKPRAAPPSPSSRPRCQARGGGLTPRSECSGRAGSGNRDCPLKQRPSAVSGNCCRCGESDGPTRVSPLLLPPASLSGSFKLRPVRSIIFPNRGGTAKEYEPKQQNVCERTAVGKTSAACVLCRRAQVASDPCSPPRCCSVAALLRISASSGRPSDLARSGWPSPATRRRCSAANKRAENEATAGRGRSSFYSPISRSRRRGRAGRAVAIRARRALAAVWLTPGKKRLEGKSVVDAREGKMAECFRGEV